MNSDNVTSLRRPDGSRPELREVIQNFGTETGRACKAAVMRRTSDYIYRALGTRNTPKLLAALLGRKSVEHARAVLECRNALTLADTVLLSTKPGFGEPFIREVFGLPENPNTTRLMRVLQEAGELVEQLGETDA